MSGLTFTTLELQNFKSFYGTHKLQLNRAPGLYYVTGSNKVAPELGANGVGKSSLWDALTWVLFGKTGRDNRPANAVVPWDLGKGTTRVSLTFRRGKEQHLLVRSRNPQNLVLDDEVVEQPAITAVLGVSEEMFKRTIVLGQFGSLFLDLEAEKQTQIFNEALSLDLWLSASDLATKEAKTLTGQVANLKIDRGRLEGQKDELDRQVVATMEAEASYDKGRKVEVAALKKQLAEARKRVAMSASASASSLTALEANRKALARKVADVEMRVSRAQADLRTNSQTLKSYTTALAEDKRCPSCDQKVSTAHLEAKVKSCRATVDSLTTQVAADDKVLDGLRVELEGLEVEYSRTRTSVESRALLDKDVSNLSGQVARIEGQDNPHCARVVALTSRVDSFVADRDMVRQSLVKLERKLAISEYWVGAFKEIRLSRIDDALQELDMAVTRHVEALGLGGWRVQFSTERVKASGGVSAALTVSLHTPGRSQPIKFQSYSGGESQRLQLAVAFGLSEVILARAGVETNSEVFDEPTRGLSQEGVADLLEHLALRAKELGRAIFVVEHHSLERGLFQGTIVVEKGPKGSRILEV